MLHLPPLTPSCLQVIGLTPGDYYLVSFFQANGGMEGGTTGTPFGSGGRWKVSMFTGRKPDARFADQVHLRESVQTLPGRV